MLKKCSLLLIALCLFAHIQAQWPIIPSPNVVNSAGGTINLSGGDFVEYSVGEVAILSLNLSGNEVGFTQGFLQPVNGGYFILDTEESFDEKYDFLCFPNPASDFLNVETSYPDFTSVQFTNVEGQVIQEVQFDYNAPIDCTMLPTGAYFVRLFSMNKPEIKTFKLFKQ